MGGGDTQTTTQNTNQTGGTNYAPWTQDIQKYLAGVGLGLGQNFLGNASEYGLAGLNPDQMKGYDMLRGSALQYGQSDGAPTADDIMGRSKMTAAQLGSDDYRQFMNPFVQSVIDPALANMRRERDKSAAEIGARSAAAGSFGGSREAIQRGQLDRSLAETTAQMVPSLLSSAYDRATGLASQNTDRQQQANATNAGNALSAFGMQSNLASADLSRQLSAINALLGAGQSQQDFSQKSIDLPWTTLGRLASLIPGVYDSNSWGKSSSTSTQPDNSTGTGQGLLGLGTTLLGAGTGGGGTIAGSIFSKLFG